MVKDDIETGCNEPQANNLNGIAPKRSHLTGEEFGLGCTAGLAVTDD
jgi:hypothetical protein